MPCERYKEALIYAAASGLPPSREVRLHLEDCSSCTGFFAREQSLLASIDAGIRQMAQAEVPASVVAAFRARLADGSLADSAARRVPAWQYGLAAAGILIVALLPLLHMQKPSLDDNIAKESVGLAKPYQTRLPALSVQNRTSPAAPRLHQNWPGPAQPRPDAKPEILVSRDERKGFAKLNSGAIADENLAMAPTSSGETGNAAPLSIGSLQIAAVELQPLAEALAPATRDEQEP